MACSKPGAPTFAGVGPGVVTIFVPILAQLPADIDPTALYILNSTGSSVGGKLQAGGSVGLSQLSPGTYTFYVKGCCKGTTSNPNSDCAQFAVSDANTVPVPGAGPTIQASVSPAQITAGQSATLSWHTANADSVNLDGDNRTLPASGTMTVSPTQTTTYTLRAYGGGQEADAQVTLVVQAGGGAPPPDILTVTGHGFRPFGPFKSPGPQPPGSACTTFDFTCCLNKITGGGGLTQDCYPTLGIVAGGIILLILLLTGLGGSGGSGRRRNPKRANREGKRRQRLATRE